ncbi:MAG: DUF1385 domain-containing protein [Solirubrobacterales bacterium]
MSENGGEPQAERPEPLRLGGMALRNGLLIHGPTSWAAAARAPDGSIEVASGPKPTFGQGRLGKVPLLRGPLRLAEAMAVVPIARSRVRSARLPLEDRRVLAAAVATAAASGVVRRFRAGNDTARGATAREAMVSLLGIVPAMAALRDHDLAAYHGVEHKAIGAYEKGSLDPNDAPKEHERCGSNLIGPMLAFSVAGQVAAERLIERPGPVTRAAAGTGAVSAAVEVFAYAERNPTSPVGRAVHALGHEIQRVLSTREPTDEQIEVGVAALAAVLREENGLQEPGDGADSV